jgi:hypothetical protein
MANKVSPGVQERPSHSDAEAAFSVQRVLNPHPGEVTVYLGSHPDLAAAVPSVCAQARQEFGEEAELTLEVYRDPEIDDRYLTLQVWLPSYGETTLAKIDQVSQSFEEALCRASGYLLGTTDFAPPRANHAP